MSINPFHCDEANTSPFFQRIKRHNVGMINSSERSGFPLEALAALLDVAAFFGDDLQCNLAPQLRVFRKVDFSHAATSEHLNDSVMTYTLAIVNQVICNVRHKETISQKEIRSVSGESARVMGVSADIPHPAPCAANAVGEGCLQWPAEVRQYGCQLSAASLLN